jgi:hypothetical protein
MAWVVYFLVIGASTGAAGFALWKGDKAARYGALLRISVTGLGIPIQYALILFHLHTIVGIAVYDLTTTAVVSFGFLYLALRYASPWLAAAMVIQGFEFYTDRIFLDTSPRQNFAFNALRDPAYAMQQNLIVTGVAVVLFLATVSAIRQRAKTRSQAAERARKIEQRDARIEAMLAGRHTAAA